MKIQLSQYDCYRLGKRDSASRWFPNDEIKEYFSGYRSPSRAWPNSYLKAAQTQKFAKWLIANKPEIAKSLNLLENSK